MHGNTFTKDEYLQMSGRAGRRGLDTKGNIIFYGDIDFLSLMKGDLPEMKGNPRPIFETYKVHPSYEKLFQNMIHVERKVEDIPSLQITEKNKKLIWALREYKTIPLFLKRMDTLEKDLYKMSEYDREEYLLNQLNEMIQIDILHLYKNKKMVHQKEIYGLKKYIEVIMNIYNHLNYQKNMITMNLLKNLFLTFNRILFNFII